MVMIMQSASARRARRRRTWRNLRHDAPLYLMFGAVAAVVAWLLWTIVTRVPA